MWVGLATMTRVHTGSPGEAFFQRLSADGCLTFEGRRLCLPQVFVLGAHKSGTTDLFHRITAHPEIRRPRAKENNFWCRVAPAAFAANSSRALLAYASGVSRELRNTAPAAPISFFFFSRYHPGKIASFLYSPQCSKTRGTACAVAEGPPATALGGFASLAVSFHHYTSDRRVLHTLI